MSLRDTYSDYSSVARGTKSLNCLSNELYLKVVIVLELVENRVLMFYGIKW